MGVRLALNRLTVVTETTQGPMPALCRHGELKVPQGAVPAQLDAENCPSPIQEKAPGQRL